MPMNIILFVGGLQANLKGPPPQKAVPNIFTGAGMGAKKLNPYHGISQGWLILLIQHIDQHIDNRPLWFAHVLIIAAATLCEWVPGEVAICT